MEEVFIEEIKINKVRHLENISISISKEGRKHLILTGKNGSGKTSLLEAIKYYLHEIQGGKLRGMPARKKELLRSINQKHSLEEKLKTTNETEKDEINNQIKGIEEDIKLYKARINRSEVVLDINQEENLIALYEQGNFIIAFFEARRGGSVSHNGRSNPDKGLFKTPEGITKVTLKDKYGIEEKARIDFVQYMVNLKADRSFARDDNDLSTAKEIDAWFDVFEKRLKDIFEDDQLKLEFDRKNYNFNIILRNRETVDFNILSDGYSAILDIVSELILRMENKVSGRHSAKNYDIQGIVLIDEIETHLHIALQKKILPFLTDFFPKVQFIVTTHSPFVLSSIENAVIYDLENRFRTTDLSAYSVDGIIESYFDNDKYSQSIKEKLDTYEKLVNKEKLSEKEKDKMIELRRFLKEIPSNLAQELVTKFKQIELSRLETKDG